MKSSSLIRQRRGEKSEEMGWKFSRGRRRGTRKSEEVLMSRITAWMNKGTKGGEGERERERWTNG